MMQDKKMAEIAKAFGFFTVAALDVKTVKSNAEVRKMCEANTCRKYNKNWTCPPACGTIQRCQEKIAAYKNGILLQTVGVIEDSFDFEGMMALEVIHKENFADFVEKARKTYPDMLPLNVGCCTVCKTCTYPDNPCRQPEKAYASVEAFGLVVSDLCKDNNVAYYYGEGKMAYTACVLY